MFTWAFFNLFLRTKDPKKLLNGVSRENYASYYIFNLQIKYNIILST